MFEIAKFGAEIASIAPIMRAEMRADIGLRLGDGARKDEGEFRQQWYHKRYREARGDRMDGCPHGP